MDGGGLRARQAAAPGEDCTLARQIVAPSAQRRPARWIPQSLALVALLVASTAPLARDPHAQNFDPAALHSIHDVLALLDAGALTDEQRAALLAEGKRDITDRIDLKTNSWNGRYEFTSPQIVMRSSLQVFQGAGAATDHRTRVEANFRDLMAEAGGTAVEIGMPTTPGRTGVYYAARNAQGATPGFMLVQQLDRRLYIVEVGGVQAFDDVSQAEQFLEPKATRGLSFEPDLGARTPAESAIQPVVELLRMMSNLLILAFALLYWLVRGGVAIVNRHRPHTVRSGRAFGVATVLLAAAAATSFAHWFVAVDLAPMFDALPPLEQGMLSGSATMTGLWPALIVLVPVGVTAWLQRTPSVEQRPMG